MSREVELPRRPLVPVAFYALLAVVAAERACLRAGWGDVPASLAVAVLGSGLVALVAWRRRDLAAMGFVAAVAIPALVGVLVASAAMDAGRHLEGALSSSAVSGWRFEATSDSSFNNGQYRCRARVRRDGCPSGTVWVTLKEEVLCGEAFTCVGRYRANAEDEFGVSSRMQGVWGSVRAYRVRRVEGGGGPLGLVRGARRLALRALEPDSSEGRAVLAGSVCGYRTPMDRLGTDELFSRCGVSHLVAVSGGHIAIVATVLSSFLGTLPMGPRARSAVLLGVSLLFVAFCGAPASAVRSWLMVAAAFGAELVGRRGHSLSSVCVAGIGMALVTPAVAGQLGFLLSVASVAGLCLLSPYCGYVLDVLLPRPRFWKVVSGDAARKLEAADESLRQTLAATLVAQLVTGPMTAGVFGELSLVSPASNVLLAPLFTPLIAVGLVEVALCWAPPALGTLRVASDVLGGGIMLVLRMLGGLPFASVSVQGGLGASVAVYGALAALLVLWPRLRRGALCAGLGLVAVALLALFVRWRYFAPPRVCVLDVGQGDAILVQDGASALLVDTGPDEAVVAALAREHVFALDAIVITHLHDDHYGGVDDLVGKVACRQVLVARGVAPNVEGELARGVRDLTSRDVGEVSYGDTLACGNFKMRVVSPVGEVKGDQNSDSIEMRVWYRGPAGSLEGLLTGDAEEDETGAALDRGDVGDIDFLKVGHHGSAVSVSAEEASRLDPEVSVASAGEGNEYGHPTKECVDVLEGAGSRFLCTKDVGDVTVRPGRTGPVVSYDGRD